MRSMVALLVLGVSAWSASAGWAQVDPPAERAVAIGPEYAAGGFHTLWFGEGYRKLWTTPVTLPVLDLRTYAGGLTPVRQVGQLQTPGLALAGADGRAYTFRSLHKEPERSLPAEWREAWPRWVVRDHTSSTHPGAAVLLPPLYEAAGLLHGEPKLVVMPDDSSLGAFRGMFGNQVGTIEEYSRVVPGVPEPHGATEIVSTRELWKRWLEGPENRVDSRAFLRARVLDLYVENYDRHRGQWRWLRLPGHDLWEPLPEDPDMAFIKNDGLALASVRSRAPKLVRFRDEFDSRLEGSTRNGSEVDRWLLTDLDREAFEQVVRETRDRFTDEAIGEAVRRLPPEWQALGQEDLVEALRARREKLVDHLMHYYRDLAKQVDVHATDRDEIVLVQRVEGNAVEVEVSAAGASEPYYRRRFLASETDEIRIYCHGGNDRVERRGPAKGSILVRVIAGAGTDVVDDAASGGSDVWAGDGALELKRGKGTDAHDAWTNPAPDAGAPWVEPRNWGRWTVVATEVAYATELELLLGVGVTRSTWGFRSTPEARYEQLSALWSSGIGRGRVSYLGTFRSPGSRRSWKLDVVGSGIERINFFGYGNETVHPDERDLYRTDEGFVAVNPSAQWERSPTVTLHAGPMFRLSKTPTDRSNALNGMETYGSGTFAEAGVRVGMRMDSRRPLVANAIFDSTGAGRAVEGRLSLDASYFPPLLDVERSFGAVEAEAATYLGRPRGRVQLALRAGGRRVWGVQPWFESAFLGGRASLRGFSRNRFAGDTSLYGGAEARAWLFSLHIPPVPLRIGALGLADIGRVWLEGEDSDEWHETWGVGGMIQPLATPFVLTGAMAKSPEQTKVYFGSGFFF